MANIPRFSSNIKIYDRRSFGAALGVLHIRNRSGAKQIAVQPRYTKPKRHTIFFTIYQRIFFVNKSSHRIFSIRGYLSIWPLFIRAGQSSQRLICIRHIITTPITPPVIAPPKNMKKLMFWRTCLSCCRLKRFDRFYLIIVHAVSFPSLKV